MFIVCVNQGAAANVRTWDNTKLKPVRIHRQRKAYIYISLYIYIYLSKCCIHSIYSPKMSQAWILWQFCKANCQAWIHKNTITYMSINSGIQTFREPFAALSRSFATAAKTHIHICRCHSDTKSLAWVLERLPCVVMQWRLTPYRNFMQIVHLYSWLGCRFVTPNQHVTLKLNCVS